MKKEKPLAAFDIPAGVRDLVAKSIHDTDPKALGKLHSFTCNLFARWLAALLSKETTRQLEELNGGKLTRPHRTGKKTSQTKRLNTEVEKFLNALDDPEEDDDDEDLDEGDDDDGDYGDGEGPDDGDDGDDYDPFDGQTKAVVFYL